MARRSCRFTFTITAVMPSSAREFASGPDVDRAPADEPAGELERELLRGRVVAADERVLVGRLRAREVDAATDCRPEATGARDERRATSLGERALLAARGTIPCR